MGICQKLALFTLFHHDIAYQNDFLDFDTKYLHTLSNEPSKYELKDISNVLFSIVTEQLQDFKDSEISLTLTGGMDSRIILASLLKAGVKPNCLTFGNSQSIDVVLSKNIADNLGLPFHNSCQVTPEKDWYYKWVVETIKYDGGNAHLHRAHRTAAISEHRDIYHPKILFTGHMGGEGLRGLSYNNYLASHFFEWVNEGKMPAKEAASIILDEYFLNTDEINFKDLINKVMQFPWMKYDRMINKLFFLFDLDAKIHHAQDIRLYQNFVSRVVPVFLQKKYLETVFRSPYHFLARRNGILSRLQNPHIYCKIIEELYPELLNYPFANGFTPKEYLKGFLYYVPLKLYRDNTQKHKYPPTFSYGKWYKDFVMEHASNIGSEIWATYNKEKYFESLEKDLHRSDEGYWHKFSNPIFFDLVKKYQN